jgi:hypothetical protein
MRWSVSDNKQIRGDILSQKTPGPKMRRLACMSLQIPSMALTFSKQHPLLAIGEIGGPSAAAYIGVKFRSWRQKRNSGEDDGLHG